jgi:hypothetical protein
MTLELEAATPPQEAGDSRAQAHLTVALLCAAVVVLAAVLRLDAHGNVALPGLETHPLPPLCLTRLLFHVDCPACGLTRSFVAMGHGDWLGALRHHRLGPVLFLLVLVQVPLRGYALVRRLPPGPVLPARVSAAVMWGLFGALWANWVMGLVAGSAR